MTCGICDEKSTTEICLECEAERADYAGESPTKKAPAFVEILPSHYKALATKYHGPTHTKGSRVSVSAVHSKRKFYSWNYDLSDFENHSSAAMRYAQEMDWKGTYAGGGTAEGYVFVRVS